MDSESPPRKKMKQARLPFQILSHKDSSPDPKPSVSSRKRQLSEDSPDDVVVKVGKKSEESKENVTVVTPSNEIEDKDPDLTNGNQSGDLEVKQETSPKNESKSETKEQSLTPQQASTLQTQMKSNLANLFEKKVFDINADVGACDCGCEEVDSEVDSDEADEALKEYLEHCNKRNLSPNSKEKKPKVKRKSGHIAEPKQSSPSKKSSPRQRKKTGKCVVDNSDSKQEKVLSEQANEVISKSEPEAASKQSPAPKSGILSKKAYDMFAKWKKTPSDSSQKKGDLKDKKVQEVIEIDLSNKDQNLAGEKPTLPIKFSKALIAGDSLNGDEKQSTRTGEMKKVKEESKQTKNAVSKDKEDQKEMKTEANPDADKSLPKEEQQQCETIHYICSPQKSEGDTIELSDSEPLTPQREKNSGSKTSTGASQASDGDLHGSSESLSVIDQVKTSLTLTPTALNKTPQRRLTPKQIERQKEIARKQEEKEKQRLDRDNEKKRLKLEKDEQKKKEKEVKEEQRQKEKEEKEKKRLAEQEQKNEEKKKKELLKAEEKRKKEEDKRKAEEDEVRKKAKASALFTSFFVPKSAKTEREDPAPPAITVQNFMPFEVKADMRMAPLVRHTLINSQKQYLDEMMKHSNKPKEILYLHSFRSGKTVPKRSSKTWPLVESKEEDDVMECDDSGVLISDKKIVEKMRAKFLQFHENHRPAYRGTWRKKSGVVTGRRPFGQEKVLDYEVDSADEWEEEEPGESLDGSDNEKDKESEDEYEVDNSVFVPHGYLSDDEGDGDENDEILSPETQKAKLKLLGEEFEAQMKSKTSALKPIIIVLTAALQASSCSVRYLKLLERRAVWQEDEGPISLTQFGNENDNVDGLALNFESNCVTFSSGPGAKKKIISEEAIPALITLVHGNQNRRVFLTNEFSAFLGKSQSGHTEHADENPCVPLGESENSKQASRPSTPSIGPNPLVLKWPGLPSASRISISNKIKELATWGPCPEEGPMCGRQCWYVAEEIRAKYGVADLNIPNSLWHYTLKPKVLKHSQSPIAAVHLGSVSSADRRALITKFTKVMTPEEKKRQWEAMKSPAPTTPVSSKLTACKKSTGKITAFTQQVKPSDSADSKQNTTGNSVTTTPTSSQPQAKKRVPLLVSVPRGQQIASSSHCSLLSKFEASTSPQAHSVVSTSTSPKKSSSNASSSKEDDSNCIVLD